MSDISRRELFKWAAVGAAALALPAAGGGSALAAPSAQWAGHRPGRVYLGMSTPVSIAEARQEAGDFGLMRTFHGWNTLKAESRAIQRAHQASMIPWVSFASVGASKGGWRAIANGSQNAAIRARARHYASVSRPVIVTFHHEPHGKMEGTRRDWADAFVRIHSVMKSETGLKNVALAPIIGDWEFNPRNKNGDPGGFLTDRVLERAAFLGTDLYQNQSGSRFSDRLGATMSWLDRRGYPQMMVGVGETGATNKFGRPDATTWWNDAWGFVRQERHRVGAVSYFNSNRNSKAWVYWPIDESWKKRKAYRSSVSDWVSVRL